MISEPTRMPWRSARTGGAEQPPPAIVAATMAPAYANRRRPRHRSTRIIPGLVRARGGPAGATSILSTGTVLAIRAAMTDPGRRLVLVAPCRDEARHMRRTLDALARQTLAPASIVAVDDGSTDDTPAILEEYRRRLPSLRVVRRQDRGARAVGPGVIEAFYAGLE